MNINGTVWSDSLLDKGKSKTQKEWKTWCEKNGHRLPTQAEYVEAVLFLLKQKDSKQKADFFHDLRDHWLMTSETFPCRDGVDRALVLGVYVYDDRLNVDAGNGISNVRPARGVKIK